MPANFDGVTEKHLIWHMMSCQTIMYAALHNYIIIGLKWTYDIIIWLWLYHAYDIVTMIIPMIWLGKLWCLSMCKIILWYHYCRISFKLRKRQKYSGCETWYFVSDNWLHWMINEDRYTAWWKWRPLRHRGALRTNGVSSTASQTGENDQTNVATKRSFQAFSTYLTLRRSRRRRIAPSDPSLNQPSWQSLAACPERPYSSSTFTHLNNRPNCEPKE